MHALPFKLPCAQLLLDPGFPKGFDFISHLKRAAFFPLHTHSINVNDPVAKEFISWKDDCDTTIRNSVHIVGRGEPNLESVLWEVVSGVVNGTMSPEDAGAKAEASLANWYAPHQ